MTAREEIDEDVLATALRRLPTPQPPDMLVSRVRRLAHLELAGRADERLSSLVLAFLLCLSWTVGLFGFFAVRFVTGEVFGGAMGSTFEWSIAYVGSAWLSGAAVLVLLGLHVRKERTLA